MITWCSWHFASLIVGRCDEPLFLGCMIAVCCTTTSLAIHCMVPLAFCSDDLTVWMWLISFAITKSRFTPRFGNLSSDAPSRIDDSYRGLLHRLQAEGAAQPTIPVLARKVAATGGIPPRLRRWVKTENGLISMPLYSLKLHMNSHLFHLIFNYLFYELLKQQSNSLEDCVQWTTGLTRLWSRASVESNMRPLNGHVQYLSSQISFKTIGLSTLRHDR